MEYNANEKQLLLPKGPRQGRSAPRPDTTRKPARNLIIQAIQVVGVLLIVYVNARCAHNIYTRHYGRRHSITPPSPSFSWDTLPTLPELEYVPCYDGYQCARLELPLDYWNGTTDKNISLAVMKLPATVSVDDPKYKGPILINPGGPSGSGVEFVVRAGSTIAAVVHGDFPAAKERHYDIVGFDPRGVGLTSPPVQCSGSNEQWSQLWRLRQLEEGTLTSSDAALGRQWRMSEATSRHCANVDDDSIQYYLTTASVARDMLELTEASARWRARQLEARSSHLVINKKPEETGLLYWGFSYGSYLGATYAALFPDRIERLIIDGVVDADDYTAVDWYDDLIDTEKTMDAFYDNCARVGYPTCPLADSKNPTSLKVRQRTLAIIQHLYHNPLPILQPYAEVVTWSDIRGLIFTSLYRPIDSYPYLANVLAGLEKDDGTLLAELMASYHSITCSAPKPKDPKDPEAYPIPIRNASTAISFSPKDPFTESAIACTDGNDISSMTQAQFAEKIKTLMELSPTLGDLWSTIALPCIKYPLRPHYRFTGPWKAKTSHPLLLIGNTADPVTPISSAWKMVKGFEGARVLTQDSPGHCSLAAHSECTIKYVHEYFFDGTLPDERTVCGVENRPWGEADGTVKAASEAHGDLMRALLASGGGYRFQQGVGKLDVGKLVGL
ncbi:hypothetical protein CAC42_5553 [Sphaceloma murrayae]|uniref:Peptidase S33 tripeptidyl aminopeptidase-like C-terminal domain-containing protein n=1 Tax=Sphaceloma murrayae TaxID=2082308 RepID=A0A2K1QYW5_9PEZI|nr:hypothetical protein CAC42_5553 [Sphaceloma murrayae]